MLRTALPTSSSLLIIVFAMPVDAQQPAGAGRPAPDRVLTDFTAATPDLTWFTILDGVMGGRSSGRIEVADGRLTFTGTLNTDGGGFSSIRTQPAELGLDDAEGIRLRFRGDGRTWSMRVQQPGLRDDVTWRADFETGEDDRWQEVWLPFAAFVPTWRGRRVDLPPVDPARIDRLGLTIADGVDGPFRIEVDAILAYGRFRLEDMRWERRPLLLFAPQADDERLAAQLADLRSSIDGFAERDMTLVVVLDEGPSRAGERALSADAALALRKRFEVEPGTFALRLCGKDGGVKRAASAPVAMRELYEQIDAMPMRREELRRDRDR